MTTAAPTTAPRPFIFVLMPFRKDLREVYESGIKAASEAAGAYAERVDEQHFTDSILERVLNQIAKADALVADMTGKNPNVYYEVGYAHALGKPVLLITQEIDDIPFDLKHRPHTEYRHGDIDKLRSDLLPKIVAVLKERGHGRQLAAPCPVQVRIDGFTIPEVGAGAVPGIPMRYAEKAHNRIAASVTLCNTRSPLPFKVDQVYLLAKHHSSVARWSQHQHQTAPDWIHGPEDGYGEYVRRYKMMDGGFPIPYFGVHTETLPLHIAPHEMIAPLRFELLAEGRRYFYDLLAQLSG